jgi:hypothetical protein
MSYLSLVPTPPVDPVAEALAWQARRAEWLDSLVPDRSRYRGSAGVEALKKLRPLAPDEQAQQDRCDEKTRAAKLDSGWRWEIFGELLRKADR